MVHYHVNLLSGSPDEIQSGDWVKLSVFVLDFDTKSELDGGLD